jgi:hypothetical protein
MMEEKCLTKFEVNSWEIYGKHNQSSGCWTYRWQMLCVNLLQQSLPLVLQVCPLVWNKWVSSTRGWTFFFTTFCWKEVTLISLPNVRINQYVVLFKKKVLKSRYDLFLVDLDLHPQGTVFNHPLIGLHFERSMVAFTSPIRNWKKSSHTMMNTLRPWLGNFLNFM